MQNPMGLIFRETFKKQYYELIRLCEGIDKYMHSHRSMRPIRKNGLMQSADWRGMKKD
jgi:hypothetical protein